MLEGVGEGRLLAFGAPHLWLFYFHFRFSLPDLRGEGLAASEEEGSGGKGPRFEGSEEGLTPSRGHPQRTPTPPKLSSSPSPPHTQVCDTATVRIVGMDILGMLQVFEPEMFDMRSLTDLSVISWKFLSSHL